jgi:hypothetical protein
MLVAASVDDRHPPVLEQPFEADHRGVEAEVIVDLEDLAIRNTEMRPGAVVRGVPVGNDGVQAVVAARQLEHDENSFRAFFDARALQRLGRQGGRRAAEEHRKGRADANAVQSTNEKVASTARMAHLTPHS